MEEKPGSIIWLKDNKPLEDRLADRFTASELPGNYYCLEIKHCWYVQIIISFSSNPHLILICFFLLKNSSESDTGLYTAKASNGSDSSTCTAQLIVRESK